MIGEDAGMARKIDAELKARAVRLVAEHRGDYPSLTAVQEVVARQLGVGRASVQRWVRQAEIDDGSRPGLSSAEQDEIRRLKGPRISAWSGVPE